jgi:serine/threonine-protein phosphatase 2A regulatory subunit B'
LSICTKIYDFNDEAKNIKEKQERLRTLQELQEIVANTTMMENLVKPNLEKVMNMIKRNIFRPLPIVKKQGLAGESE